MKIKDEEIAKLVNKSPSTVRSWRLGRSATPYWAKEILKDYQPSWGGWLKNDEQA